MKQSFPYTVKIRDLMSREVIVLEPEHTLREAIETFSANNVAGVPVTSGGKVLGVISKSDIIEFLASTSPAYAEGTDDVQGQETDSARDDFPDDDASPYFGEWQDGNLDVLDRFNRPDAPERDILEESMVSSVMTRKLIALPPDATVAEAARRFIADRVHRILVIDDGVLCGILSTTDLIRVLATGPGVKGAFYAL
jgi:CBS domain-containing protein